LKRAAVEKYLEVKAPLRLLLAKGRAAKLVRACGGPIVSVSAVQVLGAVASAS
jgi:hypothetical protein